MVSPNIPGHITVTETADEKYERLFVNDILKVTLLYLISKAEIISLKIIVNKNVSIIIYVN